jgi:GTPase-associated protein 1, N-terminal domain type 1
MAAGTRIARVDQALFGYREGHRLLASTAELTSEDRSLLARQTDHPDAGRASGWETLLAGYPLPSGRYAISMTWPASEMPRPGCVWTHALLLNAGALAECDPYRLLRLFQRPAGPEPDLDNYVQVLDIGAVVPARPAQLRGRSRAWACALTWALYDRPQRPVRAVGVDLNDGERHSVLLTAWGAAWPALRGQLSFIDAPQTPRRLPDRPYDLQLHQGSRVREETAGERLLRGVPKVPAPTWATHLVAEASSPDGFAAFLDVYDGDLGEDRAALPGVLSIYEAGATLPGVDALELINRLATTYPVPTAARSLKRDVARPAGPLPWPAPIAETELLTALVNTALSSAFDAEDLQIEARARSYAAAAHRGDLIQIIQEIKDPRQPFAASFLATVADDLELAGVAAIVKCTPNALLPLLRFRPALAHDPAVWREAPVNELWQAVSSQRGSKQRRSSLAAMIAAEAQIDPKLVTAAWRNSGSLILQTLADANPSATTSDRWLGALQPQEILKYLQCSELSNGTLTLALARLTPHQLTELPPTTLTKALSQSPPTDLSVSCFLAAHEMTTDATWGEVAILAYERVHVPLHSDKRRASITKALSFERNASSKQAITLLAQQLNHDLRHGSWPAASILALKDHEAFRALVNADRRASLAREALLLSPTRSTDVASWQREILNRAIADHADRDSVFSILQDLGRALNPFQ